MQLKDTFKVTGNVRLRLYNNDGSLCLEREHKNLVVTTGKQLIAARLFDNTRPDFLITSITNNGTGTLPNNLVTFNFTAVPGTANIAVGTYVDITGVDANPLYNGAWLVESSTSTSITSYKILGAASLSSGVLGKISSLINGPVSKMKIGENSTVSNLSDTALGASVQETTLYSSKLNIAEGAAEVEYIATFVGIATDTVPTSSKNIREAALMNSNDKMLCRTSIPVINKQYNQSLEIFWTVTIN